MASEKAAGSEAIAVPEHGQFKRALGLVDAIAIVVGSMIGSGIFIVSAETARHVGSPAMLLLCWALAGGLTVIAALCYSELSAMFPKAGGQYVFLREAYGPLAGFLYGWTMFAVIQSGTIAAVGVAFAIFLGVFIPSVSDQFVLLAVGSWKLTVVQLVSVIVIALLTWINCRGIEAGKAIQTTFTTTKVFALAALIVLGLCAFGKFYGAQPNFSSFFHSVDSTGKLLEGWPLVLACGLAMVGPLFSCDAWNNITFAGEEVKNPEKIMPLSLAIGTLLVALLYVLANVVYLLLLPLHGTADGATVVQRGIMFASENRVATAAAELIFGSAGRGIMAAAIMISTFGCLNGLILAGARVYYAMGQDKLFFQQAGTLNRVTGAPVFGLIIQGVWSALLATSGTYSELLEFVMFAALLFYVATVVAVFKFRIKMPDAKRPYRVPLYPLLPAVYIVGVVAVMGGQVYLSPARALYSLLIMLTGLPAFFLWNRKRKQAQL